MPLPFSLFLALNYLKPKRSFISLIALISVLGIILGVAVLIIVLAVMTGFDDMWREKILGFDAHVTVTAADGFITAPEEAANLAQQTPGVRAAAPAIEGLVFLQHGNALFTPVLRGVTPEKENALSRIPDHIIAGSFDLHGEQAVIGAELARRLRLRPGDRVLVHAPQNFIAKRDEIQLPAELTIAGVFEIGMWEYDIGFALVSLETAREIFDLEEGAHVLRVATDNPYQAALTAEHLRRRLQSVFPELQCRTWMDLNRQLFDALRVEKHMMFFLLIFIVLVAAFGLTNTLIVEVVQKTREIGLLKALGFSSGDIMGVFFWQGAIQGLLGTSLGMALGVLVLHFRNDIMRLMAQVLHMELFPKQLYHLSEIPARLAPAEMLGVAVLSLLICTLAGAAPAWRAAGLDPAQALRYE